MSASTMTPPKVAAPLVGTVVAAPVMTPIPMYWITVAAEHVDGSGEPTWIRSARFQIQQSTPTLTIVNGEQFDEHGFTLCSICREREGSEWCCGANRDYGQAESYMCQHHRVYGTAEQRTSEKITMECPPNVFARGPVAA